MSVELGQEELGPAQSGGSAGITWRPDDQFSFDLSLRYQDREALLVHTGDGNYTSYESHQWAPRLEMNYFITAKQQLRISTQWIALKAFGDRYWQVIIGSGHSPEHATLYCPALKLLISGDQVLPRITPNVSVFPTEPHGDPLKEWLGSSARLREMLPDDLLVLPAHEAPFYGLHVRMNQLIGGHKRDLGKLWNYLAEPRRAVDCFPALFKREIGGGSMGLATGETLAHLNCLLGRRSITFTTDSEGVKWYEQNPATSDYD